MRVKIEISQTDSNNRIRLEFYSTRQNRTINFTFQAQILKAQKNLEKIFQVQTSLQKQI